MRVGLFDIELYKRKEEYSSEQNGKQISCLCYHKASTCSPEDHYEEVPYRAPIGFYTRVRISFDVKRSTFSRRDDILIMFDSSSD